MMRNPETTPYGPTSLGCSFGFSPFVKVYSVAKLGRRVYTAKVLIDPMLLVISAVRVEHRVPDVTARLSPGRISV